MYLRFSTSRAGLENLLKFHELPWRALKPPSRLRLRLCRENPTGQGDASRFLQWQLSTCSMSRMVDQVHDTNSTGVVLFVHPLIDRPEASRPEVFIHVIQS